MLKPKEIGTKLAITIVTYQELQYCIEDVVRVLEEVYELGVMRGMNETEL